MRADRLTGALAVASLAYAAFALVRTLQFARRPRRYATHAPSVTVLKPLHGDEPLLAEKLRSFCAQDYPDYDVILGARDAHDAALPVARAVAAEFPGRVRVVDGANAPRHRNPKADTLAGMVPHARGALLVVADADMRAGPGWLRAVVAAFDDDRVGAATCLYRGEAFGGTPSMLGAMANHQHYAPSVLVAEALGPLRFTFGSTMAVRRDVLDAIGGLDALGAHIADDAMLGELVARRGLRVALADAVVTNVVHEPTFRALWRHELRWARTHRTLRPAAYAGLLITYPLPLALLHLGVARRRRAALGVVAVAAALRAGLAYAARHAFGGNEPVRPWLIPARDALGVAVWAAAFGGRGVRWADETLDLAADGTIAG